ncbi:hypothetical protein HAX54_044091 [Datura stramonium]|uniref:Uncharacterized protein n=1 Tax=Datura stramonium TaxID=4076 RepID=A0ABS8W3I2_DATST|nr:hypothetical protein [Datura stramonium]
MEASVGYFPSKDKPILNCLGISDKYLPQSVAEEFQKGNPRSVELKLIEGAGHMPQEDWPEKVIKLLLECFRGLMHDLPTVELFLMLLHLVVFHNNAC